MKQALLTEYHSISVVDVPTPVPSNNEVLVKVQACGVCGSDIHIFEGKHSVIHPPVTMGHEISGHIVKKGNGVINFQVGDYVAVIPGLGCGNCSACHEGLFNLCPDLKVIGGHIPGGFAEYVVVPAQNIIKIPKKLTPYEGAMVESLAVAIHACQRMGILKGKTFVVFGAGPIGLLIIQLLKNFGTDKVIAVDPKYSRRKFAKQLGADDVIDPKIEDVEKFLIGKYTEHGIDGCFDCAGLNQTLNQALYVTKNGGRIVLVAIYGKNPTISIKYLQRGEKTVIGTQMYTRKDFETAIRLFQNEKINVRGFITHSFPLQDIAKAFHLSLSGAEEFGKVMIDIQS